MKNLCESCCNSQWDCEVYHSSKECGLPGSSEQKIFVGCDKIDEIDAFAERALENDEDVTECSEYEEYRDEW